MAHFLHIYAVPKKGATREQIEEKLNQAADWFRYYSAAYVVYTTSSVDVWYERLENFIKPEGSLFICKLDIKDRQGWMTKQFWDWLKAKKEAV